MRRPVDAADPARHVLLGLLLEGPSHGYDLARAFAPGTTLGGVVHLSVSHLYALLARLERDALISGEQQAHGARPARRVYGLTAAGREAVQRWVDEPVPRPRDVLLDFPLKLYLAGRLEPMRAVRLVDRQRALFDAYLQELQGAAADATGNPATHADQPLRQRRLEGAPMEAPGDRSGEEDRSDRAPATQQQRPQDDPATVSTTDAQFSTLLRHGRIARTRATLQWLDHCAQVLASPHPGSTGPPAGGAPMTP